SLITPFGKVTNNWASSKGGALTMDVTVPVGTEATVHIPAENAWAVSESGSPLEDVEGIRTIAAVDGSVIVTVGSGQYAFEVDPQLAAIGTVIEQFDANIDTVTDLKDADAINAVQAQRVKAPLDGGRADALRALEALRAGDTLEAAEFLADAIAEVDDFGAQVEALDTDATTIDTLRRSGASLRAAIEDAINALLEVSAGVAFDEAGYRPGETAQATLELVNGGSADL